jgi:asparagine synthase (glutamine-hydrolysing)
MFPASIPLYILSKKTKQKATVMLSGEGADEMFAGYPQNLNALKIHQLKKSFPEKIIKLCKHMNFLPGKFGSIINRLQLTDDENIFRCFDLYPSLDKKTICPEIKEQRQYSYFQHLLNKPGIERADFLTKLLYLQAKTYLVALLTKQDKMSMAASIETRVPFLDHKLVEFCFGMPSTLKIKGKTSKYVLKKYAEGKIPNSIIYRKKAGFPVPINFWFQKKDNPFINTLLSKETKEHSFINYKFLQRTINGYKSGEKNLDLKIWMLLNLELWRQIYF